MHRTKRAHHWVLLAALGLGACSDDEGGPSLAEASTGTTGEIEDGTTSDAPDPTGAVDDAGDSTTTASMDEGDEDVVCEVGQARPCDCPEGMTGQEVCVDTNGTYSACGCPTDPDVYEEPEIPEPTYCGALECAAMVEEQTEASAKPCCTDEGTCGGEADFIFGDQCVERFGDPGDLDTTECPDEFPHFLDLEGCCRPDGACGLSLDHVNNWDVGCIERTEMMERLNEGKDLRQLLALVFLLGSVDVEFEAMACTPGA